MTRFLRAVGIIARRDFLAIVATPTFLLFLLAPLFMGAFGTIGGLGASQLAMSTRDSGQLVAVLTPAEGAELTRADARMRDSLGGISRPARLVIVTDKAIPKDADAARAAAAETGGGDVHALLAGPIDAPLIVERNSGGASGRYLTLLADTVLRDRAARAVVPPVRPEYATMGTAQPPSNAARQQLGFMAVFILFILTLLLAGQAVGMLAEEKGNKVIEILAAAVPLEAVFAGKLLGLLGVSFLFIAFWATLGGLGTLAASGVGGFAAMMGGFGPAVGWPAFILLGIFYFVMAYLLLGAVFLGVGAQAGTVREIQMLSLPITIVQVLMFGLAGAAASAPGTSLSRLAETLPLSSPFAMAARAATDASLTPHLIAILWQALWVAIVIAIAVRLFRGGVLGSGWRFWRRRSPVASAAPLTKL
jgi:ABC-2 type transport system permease protein